MLSAAASAENGCQNDPGTHGSEDDGTCTLQLLGDSKAAAADADAGVTSEWEEWDPPGPPCVECLPGEKHVYGKYFAHGQDGTIADTANSLWVWKPKTEKKKAPVVINFHPGGFFVGAPTTVSTPEIELWTSKGFAYISVGYRLAPTRYYYNNSSVESVEELVMIGDDGSLTLDDTGLTFDSWEVYASWFSMTTKCFYDAVKSVNYVVANKETLGVDPQRMLIRAESAGTGLANYVTYMHQRLNPGSFHINAIIFQNAQLQYPSGPMFQKSLELIAPLFEKKLETPLSDIISDESCAGFMGNICCSMPLSMSSIQLQYGLCNKTWNDIRMSQFCVAQRYRNKTIHDAILSEPFEEKNWGAKNQTTQFDRMKFIWYNKDNMAEFPQGADYVYVANGRNGTSLMDVWHLPAYALSYATVGEKHDIKYVVLYTNYTGMSPDAYQTAQVVTTSDNGGTMSWNVKSNINWTPQPPSAEQLVRFGCMAVGYDCDI